MTTTSNRKTEIVMEKWCDFVRGLTEPETETTLSRELERSPSAQAAVERFHELLAVAQNDLENEVPAYAVRVAKAVAGLRPYVKESLWDRALRRLPFDVTFDSSLQAAAFGTRDLQPAHQQLSFRAADFTVDVRLEQETNPRGQVIVGQLLRRLETAEPVSEVPVVMLQGDQVVGRSLTTRFGEFQIADLPPEPLDLCLLVGDGECIEVPLHGSDDREFSRRRMSRVKPGADESQESR